MNKIKKLSPVEAQKIAAGEVVERPAHIVKELIENALDAGAKIITVELQDGGRECIQVTDNGCGMSSEDIRMCIEPYATSKISSVDDLTTIHSFGFRGEALASIASVSTFEITSKDSESLGATTITVVGGVIQSVESTAAPTGTRVCVRSLFYNIPARRKFLRKRETELNQIQHIVFGFCLQHLQASFKLISENKIIIQCLATDSLQTRIAQLWDATLSSHMITLNTTKKLTGHNCTISGAISDWQINRYDRSHQFISVNGRLIKNYQLTNTVNKAYQKVLPVGRYPVVCINISIDPQYIDVNVHPRKEEIQFLHPQLILNALERSITEQLEHASATRMLHPGLPALPLAPLRAFTGDTDTTTAFSAALTHQPLSLFKKTYTTATPAYNQQSSVIPTVAIVPEQNVLMHHTEEAKQTTTGSHRALIGQYNNTYLLIETDTGLLLIDQHAAHERILYEQFINNSNALEPIQLLFPLILEFTSLDCELLIEHAELFNMNGIILESLGTQQIRINSIPAVLKDSDLRDLIQQAIGWFHEQTNLNKETLHRLLQKKLHAQMACKAAIKAGDTLASEHMKELIQKLHTTPNQYTCPHGRPTSWLISNYEIEKKFKRT